MVARRAAAAILMAGLLAAPAAWAEPVEPSARALAEAVALQEAGDEEEARALFRRIVESEGPGVEERGAPAMVLLAQAHIGLEEDAEAKALLERALELDPANADAAFFLGLLGLFAGELDEAVVRFRQAVNLDSDSARNWAHLADALSFQLDERGALAAYRQVLRLDPDDVRAIAAIARHDLAEGRRDQALAGFRKAASISPRHWESWSQAGVLLDMDGQRPEAIRYLEGAVRIDPTDWMSTARLVKLHQQEGDAERARAFRARLVELRAEGDSPTLRQMPAFVRDEFDGPAGRIVAMESFPSVGLVQERFSFRERGADGRRFVYEERRDGDDFLGAVLRIAEPPGAGQIARFSKPMDYEEVRSTLLGLLDPSPRE